MAGQRKSLLNAQERQTIFVSRGRLFHVKTQIVISGFNDNIRDIRTELGHLECLLSKNKPEN